ARLEIDLRAVEGRFPRDLSELEAGRQRDAPQGLGRRRPVLLGADPLRVLVVAQRQLELELAQPEVLEEGEDELEDLRDLVLELVGGHEEMRIVLCEAADAR